MLERVSDNFVLCFTDIMVGTRHNPGGSRSSDEKIRRMIHEEVAATIRTEILEMFGSIKTTLIQTFYERYASITEADAAATTIAVVATRP